jgi:homeobox protein homothorax
MDVLQKNYDDGIHPGYMDGGAGAGLYEPHVAHRPGLQGLHHSPHLNHAMHPYHANHVNPAANHVMGGAVPDVGKRDKDAIYG